MFREAICASVRLLVKRTNLCREASIIGTHIFGMIYTQHTSPREAQTVVCVERVGVKTNYDIRYREASIINSQIYFCDNQLISNTHPTQTHDE